MRSGIAQKTMAAGLAWAAICLTGCNYTEAEITKGMRDCRGALSISCVDVALAYANLQREKQLQATQANREDIVAVLGQAKYDEMISIMQDAQAFIESSRPHFLLRNLYPMGDGSRYLQEFSSFEGDTRITELASEYARLTANRQPAGTPAYAPVETTDSAAGGVGLQTDLADLPDANAVSSQPTQDTAPVDVAEASTENVAPSFDCARASTAAERMVCNYPHLAGLDMQLARTYRQWLDAAANPQTVKEQQRDWIKRQRDTCLTPECVQYVYEERLKDINGSLTSAGQ